MHLLYRFRLLADALRASLHGTGRIELVGASDRVHATVEELRRSPADVLLVDATGAEESARESIAEIKDRFPELAVLPLGVEGGGEVLPLIEAGAGGFVRRDATFAELLGTVEGVMRREAPAPSELAAAVCQRLEELARRRRPAPAPAAVLTGREHEVLERLASGLRNKEIAARLKISVATVKNHVHKVLAKLGVGSRREAIRVAYESGLLEDPLPRLTRLRGGTRGN